MSAFVDITGRKYGLLTALHRVENGPRGHPRWACACECGQQTTAYAFQLKSRKRLQSCGCAVKSRKPRPPKAERVTDIPEYRIWNGIMQRCHNPKRDNYPWYGGRGIRVCERWHDFRKFLEDIGARPSLQHTIDRIDSDGHYEPSNCRWATKDQQSSNTRRNVYVTLDGERMTLMQASDKVRVVSYTTALTRIRSGWDPHEALHTPPVTSYYRQRKARSAA